MRDALHYLSLWWSFGPRRRLCDRWRNWREWRRLDDLTRLVAEHQCFDHETFLAGATEEEQLSAIREQLALIAYRTDRTDWTQSPRYTLAVRHGDCEDLGELARWLFACVGIPADVVYLIAPTGESHALCITRNGRWLASNDIVWEIVHDYEHARVTWRTPKNSINMPTYGWPLWMQWQALVYGTHNRWRYTERWPRED